MTDEVRQAKERLLLSASKGMILLRNGDIETVCAALEKAEAVCEALDRYRNLSDDEVDASDYYDILDVLDEWKKSKQ